MNNKRAFTLIEVLVVVAIIGILAAFILSAAHHGAPQRVTLPSQNQPTTSGYDVQLLFTMDGVKVYRFYDAGRYIYFVDGREGKTAWNERQQSGKTTSYVPVEVTTLK